MTPSEIRAVTLRRFEEWRLAANAHLPEIESASALRAKSAVQIAARAVAAGYVAASCFGASAERVHADLDRHSLMEHLSDEERAFLAGDAEDARKAQFHGWVIESIQFLAWALGKAELDHFNPCQANLASLFPRAGVDPWPYIRSCDLRPWSELYQEADTLFMLHWRAVENSLTGEDDSRVVLPRLSFRRQAADWAIGVADRWGDVSLDT